jgi:hypothetical protein
MTDAFRFEIKRLRGSPPCFAIEAALSAPSDADLVIKLLNIVKVKFDPAEPAIGTAEPNMTAGDPFKQEE